jgi:hypothetical protein
MLHVFRRATIVLIAGLLVLPACSRMLEDLVGMNEDPETTTTDPGGTGQDPSTDPQPNPDPGQDPAPGGMSLVLDSANLTIPEGARADLPVRLSEQPEGDMTVTVEFATNPAGITIEGSSSMTFTPENWADPQVFSFSAPQDENSMDGMATIELLLDGAGPVMVTLVALDDEAPTGEGVQLTVKDSSGYGVSDHPVLAVVPLAYGEFQSTDRFRVTDADGNSVPAQFNVLNRWWARDNSIRHVVAHFEATVAPDSTSTYFFLTDAASNPAPSKPVSVSTSGNVTTVDTGVLRFRIDKAAFNLFDEVQLDSNGDGSYAASETIVADGASDGPVFLGRLANDIQKAKDRGDLRVVVEEAGPMRAVVRVSGLTYYTSQNDHLHGFAVRLYAYAGKSQVKVDYQLQNSDKHVKFSAPLYFEEVALHVKPTLSSPTVRMSPRDGVVWQGSLSSGRLLLQSSLIDASVSNAGGGSTLQSATIQAGMPSFGWADVSDSDRGVAVAIRHMAEMWPNAVEAKGDGDISVKLWPAESQQWHEGSATSTGLYWLDDMQQVVKETLFYFHGPNVGNAQLEALAANFQYHPIVVLPLQVYSDTAVTLDLDGLVPTGVDNGGSGSNRVEPRKSSSTDPTDTGDYVYGWGDFGGQASRRNTASAGSWPFSQARVYLYGHVDSWFHAERDMWGDLNLRPIWIAEYDHDDDFDTVEPSVNPYGGDTWRDFEGHGSPTLDSDYIAGTSQNGWDPRDNEHAWFYHIEEFYYLSANPWVKDWFTWIKEFRKRSLARPISSTDPGDPYFEWKWGRRGEGHMLANFMAAYRVAGEGDQQALDLLSNRLSWIRGVIFNRQYGYMRETSEGEASFQMGYVARAFEQILTEVHGSQPEIEAKAFTLLWAFMDWHDHISMYSYYTSPDEVPQPSSGSGLSMVDAAVLWYLWSGQTKHLDMAKQFVEDGVNGGNSAYGDSWDSYQGDWEARAYHWALQNPKSTVEAPPKVTDLAASASGGQVTINWTAPTGASRYVVVWSTLPIAPTWNTSPDVMQFWAGTPVPNDLEGVPGTKQSLTFGDVPSGTKIYVALASISAERNLSEVSNVASVTTP